MNEHLPRRDFLKTSSALIGGSLLTSTPMKKIAPKAGEIVLGHGNFKYRVVPNWGILDAGKNPVNDCHEMVEDAKGRLILLTNEVRNNVIIYDKSGYTQVHNHFPAEFACSIYLEAHEDSAPIIFAGKLNIKPTPGMLVMFPGILNHEVPATDGRSVVIAMNLNKRALFSK